MQNPILASAGCERRRAACAGLVAFLLLAVGVARAQEDDRRSAAVDLAPARESLFAQESSAPPVAPGPGEVMVVGRLDGAEFSIEDVSQVTVLGPDGAAVPLLIDPGSVYREFDRIVSLQARFTLPAEALSAAPGSILVQWGPAVKADNVLAEAAPLDPAQRDAYRELRWRREPDAPPPGASVATIEVIADSTAEYHFLWYLLPIALIFLLLTLRKIIARDATHRSGA